MIEAAIAANPTRLVVFLVVIFAALFLIDYFKRRGKEDKCPECGMEKVEGQASCKCAAIES